MRCRLSSSVVVAASIALSAAGSSGCDDEGPAPVGPNDRCAMISMAPEDDPATCANRCDDDQNGVRDCDDPGCAGVAGCPGSVACDGDPAPENTEAACSNGCSDDGDPLVDCADGDCAFTEACADLVDAGPTVLCPGPLEREDDVDACNNGCSDDEDMLADCRDPDCAGIGRCPGERQRTERSRDIVFENTDRLCGDGLSNDVDDLVDCDDPDCAGRGDCPLLDGGSPTASRQCPGGQIFRTEDELDRGGCTDGCSNDGDGFVDGCDPDCAGVSPCR